MQKQFVFSMPLLSIFLVGFSQDSYVKITSTIPENIEVGTALKVNYKYSSKKETYIYCGIDLLDDWTWVSFLGGDGLNVAAGTNVEGSFDIFIPKEVTLSANLKDKLNYKIKIEMKSLPDYIWIIGDYPPAPLQFSSSK